MNQQLAWVLWVAITAAVYVVVGGVTGVVLFDAVQLATVPPLEPVQFQFQGPVPLTVPEVPVVQRPVVGAKEVLISVAEPQAPFTGVFEVALQPAVPPPFVPTQLHVHGPVPDIVPDVPAVQRPAVGAVDLDAPFEVPQTPFTASGFVEAASFPTKN
jgi:hypothetical protein